MKKIALTALGAIFASLTFAQTVKDTLNAVVNVENEYNPIIVKVTKQSFTPQIEQTSGNTPLDLVFARKATPFEQFLSNRDLSSLLPGQPKTSDGYARLGYGNCNNTDLKAAYTLATGKNSKLDMFASLTGYKCDIEALKKNSRDWESRFYETWLTADYTHSFAPLTMKISGAVNNNVFNYQPAGFATILYTDKQHSNNYRLSADIESNLAGAISYKANAGYSLNTRKYSSAAEDRISENHFTAGGEFAYELTDDQLRSFGVAADLDAFTYNKALKPMGNKYDNYISVRTNPFMNFRFEAWKLRLGIHADILTANGKKFSVAPDIKFEGPITDDLTFYASATGGNRLNTFTTISELSPYWCYRNDQPQYTPTYNVFDIETGARMSIGQFGAQFYLGYDYEKDNLLPTVSYNNNYSMIFTDFAQEETRRYYAGLKATFDHGGWLNLSAEARYNKWDSDGDENLLIFTPMIEAGINARARICEGLYAGISHKFARHTECNDGRIRDTNNLSAEVFYRFNKMLRAYIQGNNLLNKNYYSYAGYLSRGVNFTAGVECNF